MSWYKKADEIEDEIEKEDELDELSIPESSRGGDCYEASGKYIMDHALMPYMKGNKNLVLVHGIVTGQGPINGIEYGHAWVEDGDTVHDYSRGRDIQMPKMLYYAFGNIDESKQFRYTPEEMRKKILDTGHWGPWDLQSKY